MSSKSIAKVALGLPLQKTFDYLVPRPWQEKIKVGSRVKVVFNRRNMTGYVTRFTNKSQIMKIKPLIELIDAQPILSLGYLKFLSKVSSYYCASLGEMIETAIPLALREGRPFSWKDEDLKVSYQGARKKSQVKDGFVAYVYCVTDQIKKVEFFKQRIKDTVEVNKQVILLLPDISLIDTWYKRLKHFFKNSSLVCMHSRLSKKEAFQNWLAIKKGEVDVVIGCRGTIFSPMPNLGLIIVDAEDNFVYKQETRPYYHARDIAIMLAKFAKSSLILSSISPSGEVFYHTLKSKFKFLKDVSQSQELPKIRTIDLKYQVAFKRGKLISVPLVERIRGYLSEKRRVLIFLNRRGFATQLRCRECGYLLKCPRCSAHLVYYYQRKKMRCPYCNYQQPEPQVCPKCNHNLIHFGGFGVERIESEAHRLFPGVKIVCIETLEDKMRIHQSSIIITTQFGLKEGFIGQTLDLCAVISVDNMLNFAEFRSSEDTFRILLNLRNLTKEELILQTYHPEHRVFKYLRTGDYNSFIKEELNDRKSLGLPPFRHLISINLKAASREKLDLCAKNLYKLLLKFVKKNQAQVFAPIEDVPFKLRSKFRLQILIKTVKVENMNRLINNALSKLKKKYAVNIGVNVDI